MWEEKKKDKKGSLILRFSVIRQVTSTNPEADTVGSGKDYDFELELSFTAKVYASTALGSKGKENQ